MSQGPLPRDWAHSVVDHAGASGAMELREEMAQATTTWPG